MHIITRKRLNSFADKHPDAKNPLNEILLIIGINKLRKLTLFRLLNREKYFQMQTKLEN